MLLENARFVIMMIMRCLTEVWTSVELQKAIKKGYVVKEVYKIYHCKKQCLLFKDFVDKFLKIIQESSGWAAV